MVAEVPNRAGFRTECNQRPHRASEIELTSPTTAVGVWALADVFIDLQAGVTVRGAAYYRDEYVKVNGQWKIKSTGYERTFEEMETRADIPSLQITENRFAKQ